MEDPMIRQNKVESELGWAVHHAKQADLKQGTEPVHLRYGMRRDLEATIQRLQRLLDEAEANYQQTRDAA